jgi:formate dehydrogenase subunit gamma
VTEPTTASSGTVSAAGRIIRHAAIDRAFHWVTAVCVLTLLATAFLPILGIEFGWVPIHWITGIVLIAVVLLHIARALIQQGLKSMWIGAADVREAVAIVRATFRRGATAVPRPGKYSFAQKLIHHAFSLVVLTALATGGAMLARIDTPWWQRNPYLLSAETWGMVYVLHDLAALTLITMVMMHVYFALRPEKRLFTRAMIRGWITRAEFSEHHDPERWQVDP